MCHLILLLPVLGLPIFRMAPLSVAGPVYAIVFLLSVWLYWLIMRSMRQPVETGVERLRQEVGEVVDTGERSATVSRSPAKCASAWRACATHSPHPGSPERATRRP